LDENAGRAPADFSRSPGFFHFLPGGLVPLLSLLGGFVPSLVAAAAAGSVICAGLGTPANSGKPPSRK
jgi:hypothetical protein